MNLKRFLNSAAITSIVLFGYTAPLVICGKMINNMARETKEKLTEAYRQQSTEEFRRFYEKTGFGNVVLEGRDETSLEEDKKDLASMIKNLEKAGISLASTK